MGDTKQRTRSAAKNRPVGRPAKKRVGQTSNGLGNSNNNAEPESVDPPPPPKPRPKPRRAVLQVDGSYAAALTPSETPHDHSIPSDEAAASMLLGLSGAGSIRQNNRAENAVKPYREPSPVHQNQNPDFHTIADEYDDDLPSGNMDDFGTYN